MKTNTVEPKLFHPKLEPALDVVLAALAKVGADVRADVSTDVAWQTKTIGAVGMSYWLTKVERI